MADERYEWLDLEAAERLLRGDSVDPVDDHERAAAARLTEALESVRRAPLPAAAPLPGEEAALAAFRSVSRARDAAAAPGAATAELSDVRLVSTGHRARRKRWSRSFRFGLAASVAGLAVGGVAVAAGTGMLPTPFDGPAPASSVSAAASPGPEDTDGPDDDSDSSHTPDDGHSHGAESTAPPSGGPSSTPPATGGPDAGTSGSPDAGTDGSRDRDKLRARYVEACLDLRAGKLDTAERRRLSSAPRGSETVKTFCDRLLGDTDGSAGDRDSSGSGDSGDSGGSGSSSGDGDSGKSDDGSDGGSNDGTGTGMRTGGDGSDDRAAVTDVSTPVTTVSFRPLAPYPGGSADEAGTAGTDGADEAHQAPVTRSA
ncbi:hypothetical protein ABZO31_20585 [Streptomyces sp. HUAS MG47]|uniref:hypothetical protein n=1 Tax=Streptomyces solicamelliae TaxID=3231716 RepID=UPI003877ABA9